ncbi:MAG: sulfur carrier protein ThiS [Deferribacterales bacterium]|nr:sulfur carrier protein ThiS [Deferribacterales bacterium]
MKVKINGKEKQLDDGLTVKQLLKQLNIPFETVVVELNGDIIYKEEYEKVILKDNDKVEIVRFVGGG